jgi:hypothetical protein
MMSATDFRGRTRIVGRVAQPGHRWAVVLAWVLLVSVSVPRAADAQVRDGATMTVLRGTVALLHGDGSADQPAPSGTVVHAGDEIRTLDESGALITFFAGTEIELGEQTALAVDRISRDGDRIDWRPD